MNLKEIEVLLKKFYDGESSLEEERCLRQYFNQETIPGYLMSHRQQFLYYQLAGEIIPPNLKSEAGLFQLIEKQKDHRKNINKRRIYYLVSGIAASLLIFIGVYFQYIANDKKSEYEIENTYEDPEKAYAEAKKALLLVSEKFNAGVQDFNKFSTFSQYQELITRKN